MTTTHQDTYTFPNGKVISLRPFMLPRPFRVAFSSGRTSGVMLYLIKLAYGGTLPDDGIVTLANTGREVEESLAFAKRVQEEWQIRIRWVEYTKTDGPAVLDATAKRPLIGCHGFKEVTFETASRNGEPFDAIINSKAEYRAEAKGERPVLPNATDRWCSGEMKHRTMHRFMSWLGLDEYTAAIGLRADELGRVSNMLAQSTRTIEYVCPLAAVGVTEADVMAFWKWQNFDLGLIHDPVLGTYEGNCDLCFLKNRRKMERLLVERPEAFDWWAQKEEQTTARFRRDRPSYRAMADRRVALALCEPDEDLGVCLCTD